MAKGIRYAYFLGWARALRHLSLILLKLLVNLIIAFAMIQPIRSVLHSTLDDSYEGRRLIDNMDANFFHYLTTLNGDTWTAAKSGWLPLIIILMLANIYLSGGILEAIQRSDRLSWREVFRACRSNFWPLIMSIVLALAFAIPVVLLPLAALDKGLDLVEGMADPKLLVWAFWIAVLIGLLLLVYAIAQVSSRLESNRIGRATFVIAILAASSYGLYILFGYIKDIENYHPDNLLSFKVYWFGFLLIMGLGGTWVIRVYHYTRLLVCRPYRDPETGRVADTVGQFFKAIGFTLRYFARTFWIWAFFTLTHVALFYVQDLLYRSIDINAWSVWMEFALGQLFMGLRIALSIAMAAAFIIFLWSQDGMPKSQEEKKPEEPEEDEAFQEEEDLPWAHRQVTAEAMHDPGAIDGDTKTLWAHREAIEEIGEEQDGDIEDEHQAHKAHREAVTETDEEPGGDVEDEDQTLWAVNENEAEESAGDTEDGDQTLWAHPTEDEDEEEPFVDDYSDSEDTLWAAVDDKQKDQGNEGAPEKKPDKEVLWARDDAPAEDGKGDGPEREWVEPIITKAYEEPDGKPVREESLQEPVKDEEPIVLGREQAPPVVANPKDNEEKDD